VPPNEALPELREMENEASSAFVSFENRCIAENRDRARVQLTSLARFQERRTAGIMALIERHTASGNRAFKAAEEGKLAKLRERCELQRRIIDEKAQTKAEYTRLCFGLIRLE
jgi:hypothetical protein